MLVQSWQPSQQMERLVSPKTTPGQLVLIQGRNKCAEIAETAYCLFLTQDYIEIREVGERRLETAI